MDGEEVAVGVEVGFAPIELATGIGVAFIVGEAFFEGESPAVENLGIHVHEIGFGGMAGGVEVESLPGFFFVVKCDDLGGGCAFGAVQVADGFELLGNLLLFRGHLSLGKDVTEFFPAAGLEVGFFCCGNFLGVCTGGLWGDNATGLALAVAGLFLFLLFLFLGVGILVERFLLDFLVCFCSGWGRRCCAGSRRSVLGGQGCAKQADAAADADHPFDYSARCELQFTEPAPGRWLRR